MAHFDDFCSAFPLHFERIEADPSLSTAQRDAFRAHFEILPAHTTLREHAEVFFRAHKRLGPEQKLSAGEHLGRAHRRRDFVGMLMRELGLSEFEVEELIRDWMSLSDSEHLAQVRADIGHLVMSAFLIWAIRNPDSAESPLSGLDLADLPCRLGLEYLPMEPFLFWEFGIAGRFTAHRPTAFDAGMSYLAKWAVGGKTVPNAECSTKYPEGLPEIVVSPVPFSALTGRVR
jgi:hypothetical protein